LIEETGKPIVSTSANLSGDSAPFAFKDIGIRIRESVDYVVDWRQEETGAAAPSTILRIDRNGEIVVLRP
jgi:L-threonylcarbamoyladenylate synthase